MPLALRTAPHFLPVEVETGSRQEDSLGATLVIVTFYCLSGDFF